MMYYGIIIIRGGNVRGFRRLFLHMHELASPITFNKVLNSLT